MRVRIPVMVCIGVLITIVSGRGEIVPVYYVGTNSQAPAQMALALDRGSYPPGVGLTNYPAPADPQVPESLVAEAVRLHMTNNLSALLELYDPGERSHVTASSYAGVQAIFSNAVDVTFDRYYWIGSQKVVTYHFQYSGGHGFLGENPRWGNYLNYTSGRYYLSTRLDPIRLLVAKAGDNELRGWTAPLASSYQYAFTNPPSGSPHPVTVLFNGTAMNLCIDTNTAASDAIESFLTNLVATCRAKDVNSYLDLWSPAERDKLASSSSELVKAKMFQFDVPKTYLILKVDFGPNAAVYYRNTDSSGTPIGGHNGVGLITIFKNASGQYRLTEQNLGGQVLFDDNVKSFLSMPSFMDFIVQQAPP